MPQIPSWLYALIKLAIQVSSPFLLEVIKKYATKLPAEVIDLIDDFIDSLLNPKVSNSAARKSAIGKLKQCKGIACPPELKK